MSLSKDLLYSDSKLDRVLNFQLPGPSSISDMTFGSDPKQDSIKDLQQNIESRARMVVFALLDATGQNIINSNSEHRAVVLKNPSSDLTKQVFFLGLLHGFLLQFSEYLDVVETLDGILKSTRLVLAPSSVQGIAQETQMYEELQASLNSITAATEALLQILTVRLNDTQPLRILATDLRALSNDSTRRILRLSERLDARVKCVQLYKSASDASRSWLISILASVFLPLSLACGILSMQTRLRNLHFLLYDFCGLLILFGTIAIAILVCARAYGSWRESIARRSQMEEFRKLRPMIELTLGCAALLGWGFFTASFLVGMIKDVVLGLKILGFGTVGLAALTKLVISVYNALWYIRQIRQLAVANARSVA